MPEPDPTPAEPVMPTPSTEATSASESEPGLEESSSMKDAYEALVRINELGEVGHVRNRHDYSVEEWFNSTTRQWWWRITHKRNGLQTGGSTQGYSRHADCSHNLYQTTGWLPNRVSVTRAAARCHMPEIVAEQINSRMFTVSTWESVGLLPLRLVQVARALYPGPPPAGA